MKKQYDGSEAPSGSRFGCECYTCPKCHGKCCTTHRSFDDACGWVSVEEPCTNCNGEGVVAD